MSKCPINFIILQSSRFPRVFRSSALWLRIHPIRWQFKMVCSGGDISFPQQRHHFMWAVPQHTAWRPELLLQSCVSKNSDHRWEWRGGGMYFSAEILEVKSGGLKALTTDCMSQRSVCCISLCSCEKKQAAWPFLEAHKDTFRDSPNPARLIFGQKPSDWKYSYWSGAPKGTDKALRGRRQ